MTIPCTNSTATVVDFTVAIRTYNGENRLPAVLNRLRSQVGTEGINWEVVIVDNNSKDNTAKVIREYQSERLVTYSLRYHFEPKPGAASARKRAIQEAKGAWIGFLDDDNLPSSNWLAAAYSFSKLRPEIGAYGSRIHGEFEIEPPKNFERIAPLLAITKLGKRPFRYEGNLLPPGAGLVIRKKAWLNHVPERQQLQGPVGKSLSSKGEDLEALSYLKQAGWEIWYNPEMKVYHKIPKSRLQKEYLMRLCHGIGLSRFRTRMLAAKAWQRPIFCLLYMANDLRKVVLHFIKYHRVLKTDIVPACEMELFLSSLISPFSQLRKR